MYAGKMYIKKPLIILVPKGKTMPFLLPWIADPAIPKHFNPWTVITSCLKYIPQNTVLKGHNRTSWVNTTVKLKGIPKGKMKISLC